MRKLIIFVLIAFIFMSFGCLGNDNKSTQINNNSTNDIYGDADITFLSGEEIKGNISVEISDNRKERERGLMGREFLPKKRGMLFIFKNERERGFWMKDTLIPLDIIFVDGKGRVTNIEHASPGFRGRKVCSNPDYYCSEEPSRFVIEVNRGYANETGISAGDKIMIERNR